MSGGAHTPPIDDPTPADALQGLCQADPLWSERYEGWTELGHGGSATVVRTHSKVSGQDIAVKVFTRVAPDEWQRFQQEVRNAQGLASPFIVRTYSPFRRGGLAWIELELVEGEDARHALARRAREARPFSLDEVREIARALAGALHAAHQAGVVHRDVKPANVLLPRTGHPAAKLGDFGTSRLAGAARITHTGLLAGTPQFCAPEVVHGQPAGPPADVYGFSLCLYLLLSGGRFPFDLADDAPPAQWLRAHTDHAARPVDRVRGEVPPDLAALIDHGLAKEPALRPSAAEALQVLEGRAIPGRPRAKRGLPAAVGVLVLLMALVGIAVARRGEAPSVASVTLASASPSVVESPASPAVAASVPAAPRAARARVSRQGAVVAVRNEGGDAWRDLVLVLIDGGGARHTATVGDGLAAGEELVLALEDFVPPPAAAFVPVRAELRLRDATGARSTLRLPVR